MLWVLNKLMQFKWVPTMHVFRKSRQKYTGCNLKTTELPDCAFIGICLVIRSSMVPLFIKKKKKDKKHTYINYRFINNNLQ